MSYKIVLVKSASKDYSILNEPFKTQIKEHIDDIEINGLKAQNIKPLTGNLKGNYRIRSGDYRIVFTLENDIFTIISILNRKEVYKKK
jgi:mRNA interferase RelE/StbE